ncbi:MAG: hypothetical protein ACE5KZ_02750 [Candidatus Scalinduaceae bacterium]
MKKNKGMGINCDKRRMCSYVNVLERENSRLKAENNEAKTQIDDLRRSIYGRKKKKQKLLMSEQNSIGYDHISYLKTVKSFQKDIELFEELISSQWGRTSSLFL